MCTHWSKIFSVCLWSISSECDKKLCHFENVRARYNPVSIHVTNCRVASWRKEVMSRVVIQPTKDREQGSWLTGYLTDRTIDWPIMRTVDWLGQLTDLTCSWLTITLTIRKYCCAVWLCFSAGERVQNSYHERRISLDQVFPSGGKMFIPEWLEKHNMLGQSVVLVSLLSA